MDKGNLSRRGFLERSLTALAGASLPLWYARELFEIHSRAAEEVRKPASATGRINVGLVGCGGMGRGDLRAALRDRNVRVVAVCDVDRRRREATVARDVRGSSEVKAYEDFRELCDRGDLDAVLVATPDHWHTLVALDAMRKGKDVYCEKPMTLTVAEGQALVKTARATRRIVQVGTQQRSEYDGRFRLACELVRNGRVGKLARIETRIGSNPTSPSLPRAAVPEGLNWDFWLGPAPKVPYLHKEAPKRNPPFYGNCHYEFRWWYAYSGGKMTDWGAHHNDIAQWALGKDDSGPVEVSSKGTEPSREPDCYDTHPEFEVTYRYKDGPLLVCSSKGENGIRFVGEDGRWIFVSRSLITASDQKERPGRGKKGSASRILDEPLGKDAERLYHSTSHMGNFLAGVRTRKECVCPAQVGHRSVTVCHIGVISLRLGGRKLAWDPTREQFDDSEANRMLSRSMRGEWKLEA